MKTVSTVVQKLELNLLDRAPAIAKVLIKGLKYQWIDQLFRKQNSVQEPAISE